MKLQVCLGRDRYLLQVFYGFYLLYLDEIGRASCRERV